MNQALMLKNQQLQAAPISLCLVSPAAAMLCADCYRGRLQKVRVICTGALSNVALLVSLYPEVIPRIEVVLMGGAMGVGNTGPVMEFNIQVASWKPSMSVDCLFKAAEADSCEMMFHVFLPY